MPFCPECQAEYREGFTRCAECDLDLVEKLPDAFDTSDENIRRALEGKELVPITRGSLDVVKEARDLLAERSVASLVIEFDKQPLAPGVPKRVQLVVAESDLEQATQVLREKHQALLDQDGLSLEVSDDANCPACGNPVPEEAEECPECGLFFPKA